MTGTNNFLTFAEGAGANVLSQTDYAALTDLIASGFQDGIADPQQLNKVWRQAAAIAHMIGAYIAAQNLNALDNADGATLLANFTAALNAGVAPTGYAKLSATNAFTGANSFTTSPTVPTASAGTNNTTAASTAYSDQTLLIGAFSNLKCSVSSASSTATFTADEIVCGLALGGAGVKIGSFNKTINLATTGAGGMDTGTAPVSGFVSVYAIQGSNGVSILACNASTSSGTIYSGANMPSGYSKSALIGSWPTNPSSQFVIGTQIGRTVRTPLGAPVNNGTASTWTSFSIACPPNAKSVNGSLQPVTTNKSAYVTGNSSIGISTSVPVWTYSNSGGATTSFYGLELAAPQTAYYAVDSGGACYVQITGYTF